MASHHHHHHHQRRVSERVSLRAWLTGLLDEFVSDPEATCPKCKGSRVEYYDPLLFSPWRTLTKRRRLKCRVCGFVWRTSRTPTTPGAFGGFMG